MLKDAARYIDQLDERIADGERCCQQLLAEFPDLPDGHMRFGHLYRRRGDKHKAAEHLRLAAAMARSDHNVELADSLEAEAVEIDPSPAS